MRALEPTTPTGGTDFPREAMKRTVQFCARLYNNFRKKVRKERKHERRKISRRHRKDNIGRGAVKR